MMFESPFAAPRIVRPMIEVPQTRWSFFSISIVASIWLVMLTILSLARVDLADGLGDILAATLHVIVGADADRFDRFLRANYMFHRGDEFGREAAVGHQH